MGKLLIPQVGILEGLEVAPNKEYLKWVGSELAFNDLYTGGHLSLSLSLNICLLYIYLSIYVSIHQYIHPPIHTYIHAYIQISIELSIMVTLCAHV